jgi:hypothetical protein
MIRLLIQAWLIVNDPRTAATFAATAQGHAFIADDLHAICFRESRCRAIGVHEIDEHLSSIGWHGQVKLGHLDPECQPYRDGQWATRGAFGLSAASHWKYLPPCYPPEALDIPIVSAWIAARKYAKSCRDTRAGWCRVPRSTRRDNRWR